MITRIIIGLLIVLVGAIIVIKTSKFQDIFGSIAWADRNLGSSNFAYKLIGLLICFIGFMVATNLWNAFLMATIGSLFGLNRTQI